MAAAQQFDPEVSQNSSHELGPLGSSVLVQNTFHLSFSIFVDSDHRFINKKRA